MTDTSAMSMTDLTVQKIKSMILGGTLGPGDRLPREADLAEHIGVSRAPLREAVRALVILGILDVRQGDGTYVTSLSPEVLLASMDFFVDVHQDSALLEVFEVRRGLEPLAAELAAVLMSEADVVELIALVDSVGPNPAVEDVVANDIDFHHRVAQGSRNSVLCSFIDGISSRTQRARVWRGISQEGAFEQTQREHRAIAYAIRDRQPSVAAAHSVAHIAGIENWLRLHLAQNS